MNVGTAWRAAAARLVIASDSPQLDAQVLLGAVLSLSRAALLAYPERELTADQHARYTAWVEAAASGVPLPYLTGRRAFYRHEFAVTPDVLIPRPETECLVEAALEWARRRAPARGSGLTLADIGTGSGAIALSLAAELPDAVVHATDISSAALDIARRNAEQFGLRNIQFHQGDLLDTLPMDLRPDLIAANLPYIPSAVLDTLPVARHEPRLALDGGPDGLALIRRLLRQAPGRLAPEGCLLLEIGADQGAAVHDLCIMAFPNAHVYIIRDYAGRDRVVETVCG